MHSEKSAAIQKQLPKRSHQHRRDSLSSVSAVNRSVVIKNFKISFKVQSFFDCNFCLPFVCISFHNKMLSVWKNCIACHSLIFSPHSPIKHLIIKHLFALIICKLNFSQINNKENSCTIMHSLLRFALTFPERSVIQSAILMFSLKAISISIS